MIPAISQIISLPKPSYRFIGSRAFTDRWIGSTGYFDNVTLGPILGARRHVIIMASSKTATSGSNIISDVRVDGNSLSTIVEFNASGFSNPKISFRQIQLNAVGPLTVDITVTNVSTRAFSMACWVVDGLPSIDLTDHILGSNTSTSTGTASFTLPQVIDGFAFGATTSTDNAVNSVAWSGLNENYDEEIVSNTNIESQSGASLKTSSDGTLNVSATYSPTPDNARAIGFSLKPKV